MKKKLLPLAMLAGLAGAAGTAQAVHVNSDGLGETLIYPFYTVENGQNTYVSLVNTTDAYKAVKVRFIEAENSAEVLDFNLYMSPQDVWTGAVVPTADGAKLITRDNSCTAPYIPRPDEEGEGADGVSFVDYEYLSDGGSTGLARTREGYIEVIEMGVITDPDLQDMILHDPEGVPGDCDTLRAGWETTGTNITAGVENPPVEGTGYWVDAGNDAQDGFSQTVTDLSGLYGYGVIINPAEGSAAGYNAVALDGFFSADALAYTSQHTDPGTTNPNLGSAFAQATVFSDTTATTYTTIDGWDAVSAVFMHDTVSNDFMTSPFVNGDTDWVVAMPTKREYVNTVLSGEDDVDDGTTPWDDTAARPPFTTAWGGTACEELDLEAWDREEAVTITTGGLQFSPRPPADAAPDAFAICKEVSVISFGEGTALYPSERVQYGVSDLISYENGWARLNFSTYGDSGDLRYIPAEGPSGTEYLVGLPVTGFAVQKYVNGALEGGVLANYAALIQHSYTRRVDAVQPADFADRYPDYTATSSLD